MTSNPPYNITTDASKFTAANISDCTYYITPDEITDQHWAVIVILSIFSAIGAVGNGLVIYVYSTKKEKQTSNIFILALALTDLMTCLIIMPMTVAYIYYSSFRYNSLCKIYHFLITSNVPLSAFIMVAIAFDRYLCICHPFLHLMTVFRAKVIVLILTAFACILGLITAMLYDVSVFPYELQEYLSLPHNSTATMNIFDCYRINTGTCLVTAYIFTPTFKSVYQKVYASFYGISLLFVLTLYVIIYRSVSARRAKRQKQKAKTCNQQKQYSTTMVQTEDTAVHHNTVNVVNLKVEMNENGVSSTSTSSRLNNGEAVPLKHRQNTIKEKRDHNRLANIKTAIMLFVVTIVFIVAFLPAWLMAHEMIPYVITVFYMYFVYNVANPVIYAFMNQMFRNDLKAIFHKCFGRT